MSATAAGVIVVGVDGSPASRQALRFALAEARLRRARLRVVHAWRYEYPFLDAALVAPLDAELLESVPRAAGELLEQLLAGLAAENGRGRGRTAGRRGLTRIRPARCGAGGRAACRRLARPRRLRRPAARLGQPAVRPACSLPGRDRPPRAEALSGMGESVLVRVGGGGFEPRTIVAPAGEPLPLDFLRETSSVCAERLVFPAFGVDLLLPVDRVVRVEILPARAGEYPFGCGFGVLRGKLIVQ